MGCVSFKSAPLHCGLRLILVLAKSIVKETFKKARRSPMGCAVLLKSSWWACSHGSAKTFGIHYRLDSCVYTLASTQCVVLGPHCGILSCCTLLPKSENKTEIFRIMEFSPLFCGKEWFIINSHNSTRQDAYCCNGLTGCVFPDFLLLINIFFDREAAPYYIDQKYFGDIWNALGGCWTWQVYSISSYFHYCNNK